MKPHLIPLYGPLKTPPPPPLAPSISTSTSISTFSDTPSHLHTSRAFSLTTALPLNYTPSLSPFLRNLDPNQQQQQPTDKKKPLTAPTNRRRHWIVTRNATSRQKGKEKEEDHVESVVGIGVSGGGVGGEVPAWQIPREAQAVDFGCFALLEAELEAEMRRRRLGVGVNEIEGMAGVNETSGSSLDGEDDVMFGLIRSSLDYSQTMRNVGGMEDGLKASATTSPTPTPSTKLVANAYWTTHRSAEAEDYLRDLVYGGVDGLAYVRSIAEFVSNSGLVCVFLFYFAEERMIVLILYRIQTHILTVVQI